MEWKFKVVAKYVFELTIATTSKLVELNNFENNHEIMQKYIEPMNSNHSNWEQFLSGKFNAHDYYSSFNWTDFDEHASKVNLTIAKD